jgi:hypothetical protein
MKRIKLFVLALFCGTNMLAQTIANGSFETVTTEPFCNNLLHISLASGWSGIRDTYSWTNCTNHTGALSALWTAADPALYRQGMGGTCIPASSGPRTGTRYAVLETTSGTSARNELIFRQVTGLTAGNQVKLTVFVDPLQPMTAAQVAQVVDFILTTNSTAASIVNAVQTAANQSDPIVTPDGPNWFKVERMFTATAPTMNLVFGFMWCNDAGAFSMAVDDFSVSSSCLANAGPDQTFVCTCCPGVPCESKVIGTPSVSGLTYSWAPSSSLNNASLAQPTASPSTTTTYTVTVSGSNCTTSSDAVVLTRVLGTCCPPKSLSSDGEEFNQSMISIFPNPSSDGLINIELDTEVDILGSIDVYDMLGKHLITEKLVKNKHRIDVSTYGSGYYTIVINVNGKSYQNKVVVQ